MVQEEEEAAEEVVLLRVPGLVACLGRMEGDTQRQVQINGRHKTTTLQDDYLSPLRMGRQKIDNRGLLRHLIHK